MCWRSRKYKRSRLLHKQLLTAQLRQHPQAQQARAQAQQARAQAQQAQAQAQQAQAQAQQAQAQQAAAQQAQVLSQSQVLLVARSSRTASGIISRTQSCWAARRTRPRDR